MKNSRKKALFIIAGLLLFYIPVKFIGDFVQHSDLPHWVAYPVHFLLGALSVLVIWFAVKRLDR